MIRRPPRSTLFPTRRSSDLAWRSALSYAAVTETYGGSLFADAAEQHDGAELDYFSDRKSTRLNSSHVAISYAVFCLKKKKKSNNNNNDTNNANTTVKQLKHS